MNRRARSTGERDAATRINVRVEGQMSPDEASMYITEIARQGTDLLNDWEARFVASISDWIADGKKLTFRQAQTLRSIHQKLTEGYLSYLHRDYDDDETFF